MTQQYPSLRVKLWGDYACFTRPEMKVERVSYPVMTPTAARGALEAIFWKPEFSWLIKEIWVLTPIEYFSLTRNEVTGRATQQSALKWSRDGGGYSASENRVQRHTLGLRNVAYLVIAEQILRSGVADDPAKYRDQFRRRVHDGRCFATPYLGCREFSASFSEPDGYERPIDLTDELGSMLLDVSYSTDGSGTGVPSFWPARLQQGVLRIPANQEVE